MIGQPTVCWVYSNRRKKWRKFEILLSFLIGRVISALTNRPVLVVGVMVRLCLDFWSTCFFNLLCVFLVTATTSRKESHQKNCRALLVRVITVWWQLSRSLPRSRKTKLTSYIDISLELKSIDLLPWKKKSIDWWRKAVEKCCSTLFSFGRHFIYQLDFSSYFLKKIDNAAAKAKKRVCVILAVKWTVIGACATKGLLLKYNSRIAGWKNPQASINIRRKPVTSRKKKVW